MARGRAASEEEAGGEVTAWRGVRYREDVGWELRCEACAFRRQEASYWPLTLEFWSPERGMGRCRACWNDRRQRQRKGIRSIDVIARRTAAVRESKRLRAAEWQRRKRAA
jgi:hypothetical protein